MINYRRPIITGLSRQVPDMHNEDFQHSQKNCLFLRLQKKLYTIDLAAVSRKIDYKQINYQRESELITNSSILK